MASQDFDRFVESFTAEGSEAAREGLDTDALSRLDEDERLAAETMLLACLGKSDSRAALGLGLLRSKKAAPQVRELMTRSLGSAENADAETLINYSLACYRIEGDAQALRNIAHVLEVSPFESVRISAVHALRMSEAPEAQDILWKTIENDDSGIVRNNAGKTLLLMAGKIKDMSESPPATIRLMIKAPHVRAEAVRELQAMLRS
jgi:HEAT repeat protein